MNNLKELATDKRKKSRRWTRSEDERLAVLLGRGCTLAGAARLLGRTATAACARASSLGLRELPGAVDASELERLAHARLPASKIAARMGLTEDGLEEAARRLYGRSVDEMREALR